MKINKKDIDRFNSSFIPEPNTGCWLWLMALCKQGYGRIWMNGGSHSAHRISWFVNRGKIKNNLLVCHKCDTPACVNPDHLFLGTHKMNTLDASKKGRLWQNKKTHCPYGHPYFGNNLTITKQNARSCKECQKIKWAQRRQRFASKVPQTENSR